MLLAVSAARPRRWRSCGTPSAHSRRTFAWRLRGKGSAAEPCASGSGKRQQQRLRPGPPSAELPHQIIVRHASKLWRGQLEGGRDKEYRMSDSGQEACIGQ